MKKLSALLLALVFLAGTAGVSLAATDTGSKTKHKKHATTSSTTKHHKKTGGKTKPKKS